MPLLWPRNGSSISPIYVKTQKRIPTMCEMAAGWLRKSTLIYVPTSDLLDYSMSFIVVPTLEHATKEQTKVDWVVGCTCLTNTFSQMKPLGMRFHQLLVQAIGTTIYVISSARSPIHRYYYLSMRRLFPWWTNTYRVSVEAAMFSCLTPFNQWTSYQSSGVMSQW